MPKTIGNISLYMGPQQLGGPKCPQDVFGFQKRNLWQQVKGGIASSRITAFQSLESAREPNIGDGKKDPSQQWKRL
jgi:hypothetical protein